MPYQSRRRHYLSRREQNARAARTAYIILIFVGIFGFCLLYINRISLFNWLKTYFY
jgi:hypothetical protein